MATIKDIANQAGVSVGSVSRYLNGYQLKSANQAKIKAAIEKLNYIPNQTAKSLKMNKSFSVGVLVDNMDNFYSSQLLAKLEQLFDQAGYFLLLTSHRNSEAIFKYKLHKLIERSVDAIIVLKAEPDWDSFQKIGQLAVPVVSVESSLVDQKVPEILSADQLAAKKVVEQMLLKRKKIAYLIPTESDYVLQQRLAGINAAYRDKQQALDPQQITYVDYGTTDAYQSVKRLIKEQYDAVFVTNYTNAIQVVQGVRDAKKVIGQDVAIAGFGYSNLLQNMRLPITLIKQPVDKIAEKVAKTVLCMLNQHKVQSQVLVQDNIFWQKELKDD